MATDLMKLALRLTAAGLIISCIGLGLAIYSNPAEILSELVVVCVCGLAHGYLSYKAEKRADKEFDDCLRGLKYDSVYVAEEPAGTITQSYIRNRTKHEDTSFEPKHLSGDLSRDEREYYGKIQADTQAKCSKYKAQKEKQ